MYQRCIYAKYLACQHMFGVAFMRISAGIDFGLACAIATGVCGLKLLVCEA
jgi:hypothetical protein